MWIQRTSHSTLKIYTIRTNNPQLRIDLRYICTPSHSRWHAIKYVGAYIPVKQQATKATPADTTRSSSNTKRTPRPSYDFKPLRAHTHVPTGCGNTNRIPANHILLFNCNKSFSCLCLFPYPPPHPTIIQEIMWLRNVGLVSVPTGCIRIYRLLPACY